MDDHNKPEDLVTSAPSDPVREHEKKFGTYKLDVDAIPEHDLLQESQMPRGPDPSPFKLGPMSPGGR